MSINQPPTSIPNAYQASTSASKLRGQYYTPMALIRMMLLALRLSARDRLIDPSCGDGGFLRGAVFALSATCAPADRAALADYWRERLVGFDIDETAVQAARAGLRAAFREAFGADIPAERFHIYRTDPLASPSLAALLAAVGAPLPTADERLLVIGNPPYVEAKRLGREVKSRLKARYPDALLGAPDLFLYFLHVCLGWLREQDMLAFVLPNKLLVNANAQRIRERLLRGQLAQLWFATQARIFADTAVYPVVLFAGGGSPGKSEVQIRRIEREGEELRLGERQAAPFTLYRHTRARALFPLPNSPLLRELLARLLHGREEACLNDVLDIRWSVSFHRSGLRERYVARTEQPSLFGKRFLGGGAFSGNGEVRRYCLAWAGWWIDYDEDALRAERNVLPEAALFARPKIVICQHGRTLRAAFDADGFVLKDTFLCGVMRERDHPLCRHPRAIVGLLSSQVIHFFYSHVFYGGHVNGGYLHFLQTFLADIPLGQWTDARAREVAALVQQREQTQSVQAQGELEQIIEEYIEQALGITGEEAQAIRAWSADDENWQLRDRIRTARRQAEV